MIIELNIQKLKAANLFSGRGKSMKCLDGVLIEIVNSNLNIVATDGHRLIKFSEETTHTDIKIIIPFGIIEQIKSNKNIDTCYLCIEKDGITITYNNITYSGQQIDSEYVDYMKVFPEIPKEREVVPFIGFDPSYLGDFSKVNTVLGLPKREPIKLEIIRPDESCLISGGKGKKIFQALLMPMKV